jgi:16S rRNA U516 pseudouridylate synthase RsuA-like enzyme
MQRTIHRLPSEFTVRVKGMLGPDQLNGIRGGKLDRGTPVTVESLESSEVETEAANRWYLLIARGASGKDVRQLFERQGALVSRVLRVAVAAVRLDKSLARGQFRQLTEEECEGLLGASPTDDPVYSDSE